MGRRRKWLQWLPWLLGLGLLALVVGLVPLEDTRRAISQLGGREIVALLLLNGVVLLTLSGRWWLLLRGQGYSIPFLQLVGHRLAAFGLSYFTPGPHFGGEPLQVVLVEREHAVPRAAAVAAVTLDKLLELLANFTFLLAGVIVVLEQRLLTQAVGSPTAVWALLLLCLPLGFLWATWTDRQPIGRLIGLAARWPLWRKRPWWRHKLTHAGRAMRASEAQAAHFCRHSPLMLVAALAVSLLGWVAMLAEFWLMVSFLGISLSLVQLIAIMTAARVAILLLLPGGLGALEASQALAFGALGLNPAVGISASLIIRARDVLLGSIGLWWGSRRVKLWRQASHQESMSQAQSTD